MTTTGKLEEGLEWVQTPGGVEAGSWRRRGLQEGWSTGAEAKSTPGGVEARVGVAPGVVDFSVS